MKNLFLSVLILPGLLFGMHHEKNPIIFYLDLEIADGKSDGVEQFVDYLVTAVNETEPKTMYYKYWISEDKKNVSLMEVCLLYTSPSPRDNTTSRMPSSA